jgi:deoxycytidylate deaminase
MDRITLNPKYGLNPTIAVCIICKKEKDMIVLLGNTCEEQAPMHSVIDFEPCPECREKYLKNGVMLVEFRNDNKTYVVAVITETAFKRLFSSEVPAGRIAIVEPGTFRQLGITEATIKAG